ncbi:MAG: alpha/beta hydrolase [Reinekea sp.]
MLLYILILALVFILFWAPREKIALFWNPSVVRWPYQPQASSSELVALAQEIADSEQLYTGIVDGAEKCIHFTNPEKPQKTRYCVLYVHGFSACRQEISPVPEKVAQSLQANYFATRLTGHGIDSEALGAAKPSDWIFDITEAFEIARTLGEKIVVISTSTGGTLATWMAQQPECKKYLAALIMVSPNYGPRHWGSPMFLWPYARLWLPLFSGETYGWDPDNEGSAKYWTYRYPVTVLYGMSALVQVVRHSDVEQITTPSLFFYADNDQTVKSRFTDEVFRRWGAKVKHRIAVPEESAGSNHVTTGDIVRPTTTESFVSEILSFLNRHG